MKLIITEYKTKVRATVHTLTYPVDAHLAGIQCNGARPQQVVLTRAELVALLRDHRQAAHVLHCLSDEGEIPDA